MTATSDNGTIEGYLRALGRALSSIQKDDREQILAEIRSHLEIRSEQGRLDEAIRSLGKPDVCARQFLDELRIQAAYADGSPIRSLVTLAGLASRRALAAVGLLVAGMFYMLAAGFLISGIMEFIAPERTGLWIGSDGSQSVLVFGSLGSVPPETVTERLGWMFPIAAFGLAVISFVIAQMMAHGFLRLMRRPVRIG